AVLRARDVPDVALPPARGRAAREAGAAAAADRRRVLVTVKARSRVPGLEQTVPASIGAWGVEPQHARPAPADRALGVALDVRVLGSGERDRLEGRPARGNSVPA